MAVILALIRIMIIQADSVQIDLSPKHELIGKCFLEFPKRSSGSDLFSQSWIAMNESTETIHQQSLSSFLAICISENSRHIKLLNFTNPVKNTPGQKFSKGKFFKSSGFRIRRKLCHATCDTCFTGNTYHNGCITCPASKKLISNFCLSACPSGYIEEFGECIQTSELPINLNFNNRIDGNYNNLIMGTSTSEFRSSLDTEDPFPVHSRGYYVDTTTKMDLESFKIAPQFTITAWIRPFVSGQNGVFFAFHNVDLNQDDMKLTFILYSITFKYRDVEMEYMGQPLVETWNHFSVGADSTINNGVITLKCVLNGQITSIQSSTKEVLDYDTHDYNIQFVRGCELFLYTLQVYHRADEYYATRFTECTSTCSTGGCTLDLTCPSLCNHDEYIATDTCEPCSGCDYGCITGANCDICSSSCEVIDHITSCKATCTICASTRLNDCIECGGSRTYMLNGMCVDQCPTGYTDSSNECIIQDVYLFNFSFDTIQDIVTDDAGNTIQTGEDNQFYPDYDSTDPRAIYQRGYYCTGNSYMVMQQSPTWRLGPEMTMLFLVRNTYFGTKVIWNKVDDSFNTLIEFGLKNNNPYLKIKLESGSVREYDSLVSMESNHWNLIGFAGYVNLLGEFEIQIFVNDQVSTSDGLEEYYYVDFDTEINAVVCAEQTSTNSYANKFIGFIYYLKIFNYKFTDISSLLSTSCDGGCPYCFSMNVYECLSICEQSEAVTANDYDNCPLCPGSCSDGCRSSTVCSLCDDVRCRLCPSSTAVCTECIANASDVSDCQCDSPYTYDSTLNKCTACTGEYVYGQVCVSKCPTSSTLTDNACDVTLQRIFKMTFNKVEGVVYDTEMNVPAVTGTSSVFYPDYETDDPYVGYERGYYFTGSSVMRLPSYDIYTTPDITFAPDLTMTLWIYPTASYGKIICRYQNSDTRFCLSINDSKLQLLVLFKNQGSLTELNGSTSLTLNSWQFIELDFILTGLNTDIQFKINLNPPSPQSYASKNYDDVSENISFLIGGHLGSGNIIDNYRGYIYRISIYNYYNSAHNEAYSSLSCSNGCPICFQDTVSCPPECDIDEYWLQGSYNACGSCSSSCTQGCIDSVSTCNMCSDSLCLECSDVSTCTSCKANASYPANCQCNSGYVENPTTGECELSCPVNSLMISDYCLCNEGYYNHEGAFPVDCRLCETSCKRCSNLSADCIECDLQFAVFQANNGGCVCPNNAEIVGDFCLCKKGFYDACSVNCMNNIYCSNCPSTCSGCTSDVSCYECIEPYVLVDGRCEECGSDQYFHEGNCENCPSNCSRCNIDNCFECKVNTELVDGSCECIEGFYELDGQCTDKYLLYDTSVNDENSISITFYNGLSETMDKSDITVEIENNPEFSFKLSGSSNSYEIKLDFKDDIQENTLVEVSLSPNITSVFGDRLKELIFTENLNYELVQDEEIEEVTDSTTRSVVGVGASSSIINFNFSGLWGLINSFQLLTYIPLVKYPIHQPLRTFLISLQGYVFIPNFFQYFIPTEKTEPYQQAQDAGFDTYLFVVNGGEMSTFVLSIILLWPIFFLMTKSNSPRIKKYGLAFIAEYKYTVFLRWWIEAFIELGFASVVQIMSYDSIRNEFLDISSLVLAAINVLAILATPILMVIFIVNKKDTIKNPIENPEFHSVWGCLFYEFVNEKHIGNNIYYLLFILRRIFYLAIIVFLDERVKTQSVLNTVIAFSFSVYLIVFRPFKDKLIQLTNVITEVSISIVFLVLNLFAFEAVNDSQETLETIVIIFMISLIGFQALLSLLLCVVNIINGIRNWRNRKYRNRVVLDSYHSERKHISMPEVLNETKAGAMLEERKEILSEIRIESIHST